MYNLSLRRLVVRDGGGGSITDWLFVCGEKGGGEGFVQCFDFE